MSIAQPTSRIITFYSYKGGTGRSMALANMAWILACAGRRVLTIDWDLEAPGLHRYFRPFLIDEEVSATDGLMDLVENYANAAIQPRDERSETDANWYLPYADFSDYIVSVNFPHFRHGGKIDLLPAGRQGDHYALLVSSFNWQNFYDRLGGGGFIEAVKQRARTEYDYVLIDSRTGVSDTAGICSVQMPDTLIVCYTYNNQSIKGASAVARSSQAMRKRLVDEKLALRRAGKSRLASAVDDTGSYDIFPAAMRVDSGESDRLALRQAYAQRAFDGLVTIGRDQLDEYWKSVEIPHTSFYSYEEVLAPFKDDPQDPKSILAALLRLTRYVTRGDVDQFRMAISPEQRQAYLDAFAETPLTAAGKTALADSQKESEEQTAIRLAETALAELPEDERLVARRVLMRLVRIGGAEEGGRYFPIKANLRDFDDRDREVIHRLAAHQVLAVENEYIGFADARLVAGWRTLTEWIASDRDFLVWRQQLRTYLVDWERSGRDRGALLSGRLLHEADLVALRRDDDLTAAETEYIVASRAEVETKATAEAAGAERLASAVKAAAPAAQKSRARQAGFAAAILAVAAVLALTVFVLRQSGATTSNPPGATVADGIRIPNFVGLSSTGAQTTAQALGLTLVMSDGASPESPFLDGIVAKQDPPENATVARGNTVRLIVSAQTVVVPALARLTLTEALAALDREHLKLGETESSYVPNAPIGTVVDQKPGAGSKLAAGSGVNVIVAREPKLTDYRVGIYFPEGDVATKPLADRIRDVVRKAGSQVDLFPRPAEFFTGRLKPRTNEIRYNSDAEKQAALELQRLLQGAGFALPFEPTYVNLRTEGFLSVFLPPQALPQTPPQAPPPATKKY